ncbi:MAG: NADH-quinone oxidoreductase subunit C [Bacteroidales bacterium]|nr:NADH-quinone oxidoreductase subunit C [Bacteroidales bacterium]
MEFYRLKNNPGAVNVEDIPVLSYDTFIEQTLTLLKKKEHHAVDYFTACTGNKLRFFILIAGDDTHTVYLYSHVQERSVKALNSLTALHYPLHLFEREISEEYGIVFTGHPWPKPLRYPCVRADRDALMSMYPFYSIESEELHEVGVGPVHAGVIEPGHFRFICHGENVIHLEIQLGYQHRGLTGLMTGSRYMLQRALLSECIAGDTAIGHALAFSQAAEALGNFVPPSALQAERIIALEMERIAVHIGDTAALCGDVGYQLGQAACEALRTIVINTTQDWCGNRFGKGLVRPGGTNFPISVDIAGHLMENLNEVRKRFNNVTDLVYNNTGILSRFENTGTVSHTQARHIGAVGMAARASGLKRDVRASHPFQAYTGMQYTPPGLETGDVLARGYIRKLEADISFGIIMNLLDGLREPGSQLSPKPDYQMKFKPETLSVSLTEGWRGEISHCILTDEKGEVLTSRIKDPSVHNWTMLALAVRGAEISDFPLCNKSFNLSYCGHDL